MGYKVVTKDSNQRPNLWKADAEALIALLALRIAEYKEINPTKIVNKLNYDYLRKRKKTKYNNCSATLLQRAILEQRGY